MLFVTVKFRLLLDFESGMVTMKIDFLSSRSLTFIFTYITIISICSVRVRLIIRVKLLKKHIFSQNPKWQDKSYSSRKLNANL